MPLPASDTARFVSVIFKRAECGRVKMTQLSTDDETKMDTVVTTLEEHAREADCDFDILAIEDEPMAYMLLVTRREEINSDTKRGEDTKRERFKV